MDFRLQALAGVGVAGAIVLAGWQGGFHNTHVARAQAVKNAARVTIIDSNVAFDATGIEKEGYWGFGPQHIDVHQGDQIEFDNPSSNNYSHTVASITWGGNSTARTLDSGSAFSFSSTGEASITPGESWTLDTTSLKPGQYLYYCTIHPWMVGTLSVEAPE
jgi:plastocyanin